MLSKTHKITQFPCDKVQTLHYILNVLCLRSMFLSKMQAVLTGPWQPCAHTGMSGLQPPPQRLAVNAAPFDHLILNAN